MLATRVDRAKVAFDIAEREFKRKTWLQERNAAPVTEVQDSQSRLDAAGAALRESQAIFENQANAIDAANADIKRAMIDIGSLRAGVDKASAQLQTALTELDRTKIKSPVDGVIVGRSITEGQTLATGLEAKTLFTIAGDLSHMEVNARVDESDIAKIKVGQSATFTVDLFPGRTFEATVKQISNGAAGPSERRDLHRRVDDRESRLCPVAGYDRARQNRDGAHPGVHDRAASGTEIPAAGRSCRDAGQGWSPGISLGTEVRSPTQAHLRDQR